MPERWTISLGESTEGLAGRYAISREAQDAFAVRSHRRAAAAWDGGFYDDWVVPVPDTSLVRDEILRPDASVEALAKLTPAFRADGTVTAGNSSTLNDGAAAVLIGSPRPPRRSGASRSHGSRAAASPESTRTCSGSARWSRSSARCAPRASAGPT